MDPTTFWAGTVGRVEVGGRVYHLSVHDVGALHVPSGELGACDPFMSVLDALTFAVPPGSYPVQVTVADVPDGLGAGHLREAYLSLLVGTGEIARIEHLVPVDRMPPDDDEYYGVGVESGAVAFVDSAAILAATAGDGPGLETLVSGPGGWNVLLDDPDHLREGSANISLPGASDGANIVLARSGRGVGFYPVLGTFDAEFRLLGIHIDLEVVA